MTPLPLTLVHDPLPLTGVLADKKAESTHIVWSAPALAVVGKGVTLIAMLLLVALHPLAVITQV